MTTASPMPMPNSAVMIGRPIASSDPNAISRMRTAARMPISSLAGCVWSVNMEPPSSTCSVGVFALLDDADACASRGRRARRSPARRTGSRRTRSSPSLRDEPRAARVVRRASPTRRAAACASSSTTGVDLVAAPRVAARRRRRRTLNTRSPVSPLRAKSCLQHVERASATRCRAARTSSADRRRRSARAR